MFDGRGWDAGLDEAQLAAATHGDAPLVILAGAGTGKTRTLVSRVAHLVDRGVDPSRVLLLTFTRRAADDMLARAAAICSDPHVGGSVAGGTFHAVARRLVCEHAESLGLPPAVSVLDPADARDLLDILRSGDGQAATAQRWPRADTLVDIYSRSVNTARPAREVIAASFPWCEPHATDIVDLFRAYVARKREHALLDFDDLLLAWRTMLADSVLGPLIAGRWDHVLVDEYQDVNQIQVDIVTMLRPAGRGLTVVGDDAQAIYGFRGTDAKHIVDLVAIFPDVRVVCLERNFRSRQRLLDLANAVRPASGCGQLVLRSDRLGGARARLMRCHDAPAEARLVVDAVLEAAEQGQRLRDQAVLMRAAHHSDLLEVELTARGVPFVKFGGLKFLERAHIKDFVAGLRLLDNRADEVAWFRLLRLHDGIGPTRARALLRALQPGDAGAQTRHADVVALAPASARTSLAGTLDGVVSAREQANAPDRAAAVVAILTPLLVNRYTDHAVRLGDLNRLVGAAAAATSLADFLAELTLDPPASTGDLAGPPRLDDDYLVLSTVHSAKGLEWDTVHVIHVVDGAFPSDMALSTDAGLVEEQRLFYVAVTRAREQLAIYTPMRMPHHRTAHDDKHSYAKASRFLDAEAMSTLDVHEAAIVRPTTPRSPALARVTMPTLDELWQ
ncbi:MAG TPA: ATP-dependent helicase [Acidothermaceae bacterium]|jgi:DNA helicase-2/ATP-dependent DNA helicase PcrA